MSNTQAVVCFDRTLLILLSATMIAFLTRPLGPWWLSADCDATYAASALNLMMGLPTEKLDHPGLPLQAALTLSFKLHHLATGWWTGESTAEYVAASFADPSRVLWILRVWALAMLMGVVATVYLVCRRAAQQAGLDLNAARTAGLAGVVCLMACPGTLTHATSFRPENLLLILCWSAMWLLAEAWRLRCRTRLFAGAALIGWAVSVKIHALALMPVAAFTAWSATRWPRRSSIDSGSQRDAHQMDDLAEQSWRVGPAMIGGAGWLLCVIWLNMGRDWTAIDGRVLLVVGGVVAWTAMAALLTRRSGRRSATSADMPRRQQSGTTESNRPSERLSRAIRPLARLGSPVLPAGMLAGLLGLLIPNACLADELTPMLRAIWYTVRGAAGQEHAISAALGTSPWAQWTSPAMLPVWGMSIAACIGLVKAVRHRNVFALLCALGAAGAFALAAMRGIVHFSPHHYGLALGLAIPLMLEAVGLTANDRTTSEAALKPAHRVALILLICAWPIVAAERSARGQADRCAAIEELTALCAASAAENEVILCDYWAQNADAAHFMQAREMSRYKPDLRYRSLPDTPTGLRYAVRHGLRPAFYLTSGPMRTRISCHKDGSWTARGAWGQTWRVAPLTMRDIGGLTLGAWLILGRLDNDDTPSSSPAASETESSRDGGNETATHTASLTNRRISPTVVPRHGILDP